MHPNKNHQVKERIYYTSLTPENQGGLFMFKSVSDIITSIESENRRSAWDRAVKVYALELLEDLPKNVEYGSEESLKADLLNGARDWSQYSYGGCSLIYNEDIAERCCTPSEFKKTRGGERRPNSREEWLDVQARALSQAARHIIRAASGRVVIM
jgi:hypothetical protein